MAQLYGIGTSIYARRKEEILILERAAGTLSGAWYLPGGALDPGETLEQCALRELREETGLAPTGPLELLSIFPMHVYGRDSFIVSYVCDCEDGEVVISHEHSGSRWVDPRRWREEAFAEENVRKLEEANPRVGRIVRVVQQDLDLYLARYGG